MDSPSLALLLPYQTATPKLTCCRASVFTCARHGCTSAGARKHAFLCSSGTHAKD